MCISPSNRYIALGFLGAGVASILGAVLSPSHPLSAIIALARAIAYILLVFAGAATTTYLGFLIGHKGQQIPAKEVSVRIAAATLWLPPLLMFSHQRSWFALVIWAVLLVEAARLVAFFGGALRDHADVFPQTAVDGVHFSLLKRDFPAGISTLGALLIQGAIFSEVGGHDVLAGLLYLAGTAILAYRVLKMLEDSLDFKNRNLGRRILPILISTTLLIAFAWLPDIARSGGSGSGGTLQGTTAGIARPAPARRGDGSDAPRSKQVGQSTPSVLARLRACCMTGKSDSGDDSFAIAKHILESRFPEQADGGNTLKKRPDTKIATTVVTVGPVFPGIELYPEVRPHTTLVAPPLAGTRGFGAARADPLSIPFDGVYWFWRGPSDQPPLNSVVMHGRPSAQFFRSTDGDGMSMEARQNLGFAVDPKRFGAIELLIENADPFPNTVSILLKIRNTRIQPRPLISLGMQDISTPQSAITNGTATAQVLRFRIPTILSIGSFDELTVSYFLKGARSNRSARIAINRFLLVPRGG